MKFFTNKNKHLKFIKEKYYIIIIFLKTKIYNSTLKDYKIIKKILFFSDFIKNKIIIIYNFTKQVFYDVKRFLLNNKNYILIFFSFIIIFTTIFTIFYIIFLILKIIFKIIIFGLILIKNIIFLIGYFLLHSIKPIIFIICLLISVAYFTLFERKILALIQRRKGPNVVGIYGLLQPLSDGLKLFVKELIIPSNSDKILFLLAPLYTFIISLMGWAIIPLCPGGFITQIDVGILYILAISSLGVYGIIIAGWSSNSRYALLGSLRSAAQLISYELIISFNLLIIILCSQSLNLIDIVYSQEKCWYIIPLFPSFIIMFISMLAETNRHPFDLPEAEAELVSGYNVEYSSMGFAFFFLGEYSNMLLMSSLLTILFFGGWLPLFSFLDFFPSSLWFSLKMTILIFFIVISRAILPRYRYDQLMKLSWKIFLPLSIIWFFFICSILFSFSLL